MTCVNSKGESVVDMCWMKESDVGRVVNMKVWTEEEVGSDHFM
jgi:hypothetical protein